ncbi:MAG: FixH family protein [Saprospiraceae bacterium]
MKLSWGSGIAIFYTLFVVSMVVMVLYSKTLDNSLVVNNYYEHDLKYQDHLDKLTNAKALVTDLVIRQRSGGEAVQFLFPKNFTKVEGRVQFYRADDRAKDFFVKIAPDATGQMEIPTQNLTPGRWTLKVNWSGDGKAFYKEKTLVF